MGQEKKGESINYTGCMDGISFFCSANILINLQEAINKFQQQMRAINRPLNKAMILRNQSADVNGIDSVTFSIYNCRHICITRCFESLCNLNIGFVDCPCTHAAVKRD